MSSRGRAALSGLAVIFLFALPLLPEIVGVRRLIFRDAQVTHWPWRQAAMASLRTGDVPFVNDSASGGEPFLANPNAALLYPTLLLDAVLPDTLAFNLHYLLHVLWAFFGARALASRLGLSEGGSLVAGIAFAFSGILLSYGSAFWNSAAAAAWLPWCAAAAADLVRAETGWGWRRAVAATAIAFALQLLAGEPAISLLTAAFVAVLSLALTWEQRGQMGLRARRLLAGGALAALVAAALAAPLLLPLADIFSLTYRGQHVYSERAFGASPFAAWRMIEWLFPRFNGDPGTLGPGGHWQYALHGGEVVYIWAVTFGVVPLLLILLAGLRADFWKGPPRFLLLGGLLSLLFSFGFSLPFFRLLSSVELLRRLRYPIKFHLLTTLCVALAAGFAADRLTRRRGGRELVGLAAAAALFAAGWSLAGHGGALERWARPYVQQLAVSPEPVLEAIRRSFRGDAVLGLLTVGLLALVLFAPGTPRVRAHVLGFTILLAALPWGLPLFVSADQKDLARPPALLPALSGSGRLFVSPRLAEFNVLAQETAHSHLPPRVAKFARVQVEELIPATGAAFGVRYLFDEDPDGSYGYYNRIASEALAVSSPAQKSRILRAYSGRWVLADEAQVWPESRPVTGFAIAGRRLVLHELVRPLPELRWAGRARRRGTLSGAIELIRSEGFRPENEIVLADAQDREPKGAASTARVRVRELAPDRAEADVEAASGGHLVFSRTFFPAWKAWRDGRSTPVLVANARDLAVEVPAGSHHVRFRYDRGPFHQGVAAQAAALVACLGLTAWARVRRRELPARAS